MLEFVKVSIEWDGTVAENEPEETAIPFCALRLSLLDVRYGVTFEPIVVPTAIVTDTERLPLFTATTAPEFPAGFVNAVMRRDVEFVTDTMCQPGKTNLLQLPIA